MSNEVMDKNMYYFDLNSEKNYRHVQMVISKYFTSSGSISLNSSPRPVHAMKEEFEGSSSRVTRNCHS